MHRKQFILSLDQGTTSSRALIFTHSGTVVASAYKEFTQYFPQSGWVEHDPAEIWSSQASVIAECLVKAGIDSHSLAAIGITNQRETTIIWDRRTGKAIYPAIVWQDKRTSDYCDQLKRDGLEPFIRNKTGLVIDSYFSASKIRWILDNVPNARVMSEDGHLAFGTVDSWLMWNLTGGRVHLTDASNASRTMLFNIHTGTWDSDLLKLFNIPVSLLPEVKSSSEVYALSHTSLLTAHVPLAGIAGDQQAALFGQQCINPGMIKNTYGTGCFMMMNTGTVPINSSNNLLTTVAWKLNNQLYYALEGSIFIGGAVVQWLRDGLGIINSSAEIEDLARRVPDSNGVYLVPAFAGLGAPHWNQHARGTIVGMTRGTTTSHIARAALDSIAFQTMEVLKAMEADSGLKIEQLRVDGGASVNNLLMAFQADLLNVQVVRPQVIETTALGAAYLAGLATGFWQSTEQIASQWQIEQTFNPVMPAEHRNTLLKGWSKAVKTAICWAEN